MKSFIALSLILNFLLINSTHLIAQVTKQAATEKAKVVEAHSMINTPDQALEEMKAGNQRFYIGKMINSNYKRQIKSTKTDQHPHSIILSCIDSRIPPEIIFDQGIGNIFVARVAGNIEDANIIGSMEFATKIKGSKLIIVMGHNQCGAVKGAMDNAELGNLTQLCDQIKPALITDAKDKETQLNESSKNNIRMTISDILKSSPVITELVKEKKVKIVGAFYDITNGRVSFLD
jgi:carbonic anhydrase